MAKYKEPTSEPLTGSYNEKLNSVKGYVNSYLKKYANVKVGISHKDQDYGLSDRANSEDYKDYDTLSWILQSTDRAIAVKMEEDLIKHFGNKIDNKDNYTGPGSLPLKAELFYVYAVYK